MLHGERVVSLDRGGRDRDVPGPPKGIAVPGSASTVGRRVSVLGAPQLHVCIKVSDPQPLCWPGTGGWGAEYTSTVSSCRVWNSWWGLSGLQACVLWLAAKLVSGSGGGSQGDRQRPAGGAVPGLHAAVCAPRVREATPGSRDSGPGGPAPCPGLFLPPADPVTQQPFFLSERTGLRSLSFHLRGPRDTLVISTDVTTCRCCSTGLLATIICIRRGASFLDWAPELTSVSVWLKKSVAESLDFGRG